MTEVDPVSTGTRTAAEVSIEVATGGHVADAGALTAEAYLADRLLLDEDPYELELRDAERRSREATLLVATVAGADGAPVVVGTITLAPYGTSYAEIAQPGELELRMLAVAPEVRGRGIAESLMRAALRECVVSGARRIVLSTMDAMETARRLYDRLGFVEQPERRWGRENQLGVRTWTPPAAPGAIVESATWPPLQVELTSAGWRVGLSDGITRRANSALTTEGHADVAGQIDEVEEIYAAASLPSIVRVGASAVDRLVERELETRGYQVRSDADVLVRALDDSTPPPGRPHLRVAVTDRPDDAWRALWLGVKKAGADEDTARRILEGADARYLLASVDGEPAAVIRVAYCDDWAALSCLVVHPAHRREGLGRELTLRALAVAREHGSARAFLQVETHNQAALRLYARLGFQPADSYRYRER